MGWYYSGPIAVNKLCSNFSVSYVVQNVDFILFYRTLCIKSYFFLRYRQLNVGVVTMYDKK